MSSQLKASSRAFGSTQTSVACGAQRQGHKIQSVGRNPLHTLGTKFWEVLGIPVVFPHTYGFAKSILRKAVDALGEAYAILETLGDVQSEHLLLLMHTS